MHHPRSHLHAPSGPNARMRHVTVPSYLVAANTKRCYLSCSFSSVFLSLYFLSAFFNSSQHSSLASLSVKGMCPRLCVVCSHGACVCLSPCVHHHHPPPVFRCQQPTDLPNSCGLAHTCKDHHTATVEKQVPKPPPCRVQFRHPLKCV